MKEPQSIRDIDLNPLPRKKYWNSVVHWKEDIIYFLLVDRFHDDHQRKSFESENRSKGFGSQEQLQKSCGGTLNGISKNLNYIKDLGCTALWLSPVFENNIQSYHGYAIQNFLKIDPRFGTKEDLVRLISIAHELDMKVFLDVVLNHSGDNWFYKSSEVLHYKKGKQYEFGGWRMADRPLPSELRNSAYYKRKGEIQNWDLYPETREGDFFSLKKFNHDESREGLELQEILIKIYSYWIKETDCDGFRIDAAKHIGELPLARFCTGIKEYASSLGKNNFFIFGEVPADDKTAARFFEPSLSEIEKKIYHGLDSMLDFPLHYILPKAIKGIDPFEKVIGRYASLVKNIFKKNKEAGPLVSFVDNHDQIEDPYKKRFGAGAHEKQVIAGIGLLLTLPGVPCIYYGTEQGFEGEGQGDEWIREAMFDLNDKRMNALNKECMIYKEIAGIIAIRKKHPALKSGSIIFPQASEDGVNFSLNKSGCCLFIRKLADENLLVAYNSSINEKRVIYVQIEEVYKEKKKALKYLYGGSGTIEISRGLANKKISNIVRLELDPMQFIILK